MSGLIDMWTNELSKLKEKGQTIFPHGSSHPEHESSQAVQEKEKIGSTGLPVAVGQFTQINKPRLLFSEASVSMLVSCFSP